MAKPSIEATSSRVAPLGAATVRNVLPGRRCRLRMLVTFVALLERLLLRDQQGARAQARILRPGGIAARCPAR